MSFELLCDHSLKWRLAPQQLVSTLKRQIPKNFLVGAISVPQVAEALARLRQEESPGEPLPRDHWHVGIGLIGLCLILFPLTTAPLLHLQTLSQTSSSSPSSLLAVLWLVRVTSLLEGGEHLRSSFEVSVTLTRLKDVFLSFWTSSFKTSWHLCLSSHLDFIEVFPFLKRCTFK